MIASDSSLQQKSFFCHHGSPASPRKLEIVLSRFADTLVSAAPRSIIRLDRLEGSSPSGDDLSDLQCSD